MSLDYAIDMARKMPYHQGQCRVYAFIIDKKGNVLSEGFNQYTKTHPKQAFHAERVGLPKKITLHAEIAALVRIRKGVPYKIFVARVDSKGNPKLAKPCPVCYDAIKHSGIEAIEHTIG